MYHLWTLTGEMDWTNESFGAGAVGTGQEPPCAGCWFPVRLDADMSKPMENRAGVQIVRKVISTFVHRRNLLFSGKF